MFLLFSTKIVVIVSSKCPVFLKMTTMLRTSTTALIQAPACTTSVEITLALNPWCFGARVDYVHTPSTLPPQCEVIHDSLSVLPKLEKYMKPRVIHFTGKLLPCLQRLYPTHASASRFQVHLGTWNTCMNRVQALKMGAVTHSEIKCCKKDSQETHTRHPSKLIL